MLQEIGCAGFFSIGLVDTQIIVRVLTDNFGDNGNLLLDIPVRGDAVYRD